MSRTSFDHAAANARSDCPKCKGTGTFMYDHNHSTICDLCCKHDLGWWQLSAFHFHSGQWCCKAGCGYVSPEDPPENEKWHDTDEGWRRGAQ